MVDRQKKKLIAAMPVILGSVILIVMGFIIAKDTNFFTTRKEDLPPTIDFTWSPAGAVSLKGMRGYLVIRDDYALNFKTYRMRLVELDKTIDLPIDGLIGKDYEQPISFSLIADDPHLRGAEKLTVQISIADDRDQKTSIERVIRLK